VTAETARDATLERAIASERAVRELARATLPRLASRVRAFDVAGTGGEVAKAVDRAIAAAALEPALPVPGAFALCAACGAAPRTNAVLDCGHVCLCATCDVKACPVCGLNARETCRVYL